MTIKIEIGGYETIFKTFDFYNLPEEKRAVFNLIDLSESQYKTFCQTEQAKIFLDTENNIICFRCEEQKIQFAIHVDDENKVCFDYYFVNSGEIGFSAKSISGQQYKKINIFCNID